MIIASIVAILGPIIPAPLHIPTMCVSQSPSLNLRSVVFLAISVVRMPSQASKKALSVEANSLAAAEMPALIFSIGRNRPMMPVLMTTNCSAVSLPVGSIALAAYLVISMASSYPRVPVQAFAFPLLTTTPRIVFDGVRFRETTTGAATI